MKGAGTLVARQQGEEISVWQNTTGNPGMATAGSGDVLTGTIASLAGQGKSLWDSARAGVWLHGAAGDLAANDKGEYGMIAGDIVAQLPYAIKNLF
jgi:NAD(P)H-hydrate epimerase